MKIGLQILSIEINHCTYLSMSPRQNSARSFSVEPISHEQEGHA